MSDATLKALEEAAKGLLYMSESDEPFQAFCWKNVAGPLTRERLLEWSEHEAGSKVEEVSLDTFFKELDEQAEYQGDDATATAEQSQRLRKTIEEHLADVKVFKIGAVNLDIYIVGKTKAGDWEGVKTKAVET